MSRQTLVLDSTQITDFLTCQQYWKYKHDEQLVISNRIKDTTAAGSYGHRVLEVYYKNIANGLGPQKAMKDALKIEIDIKHNWAFCGDITEEKDLECSLCKRQTHSGSNEYEIIKDQICKPFPVTDKLRELVKQRLEEYWVVYSQNDIIPNWGNEKHFIETENGILKDVYRKEPLVEQGFSYELLNTPDYLFVLEGRVDVIGILQGYLCFLDHKFQEREKDLYSRAIQFRNYSLAMDLSMGVYNYIRLHQKTNTNTYIRKIVTFNKLQREDWKLRLIEIYKRIANDMDKGHFEKNESMCPGRYGYICEFTKLCEEKSLVTIEGLKNVNYVKKEEWKPW